MITLTEEEAQAEMQRLGLTRPGTRSAVAIQLLLSGEVRGTTYGPKARSQVREAIEALERGGWKIDKFNYRTPEQEAKIAAGDSKSLGRSAVGFRLVGKRSKSEVVKASGSEVVAPKPKRQRTAQLPPLPEFLGDLKVTGQVLTDSGQIEIHLRNGEGTYIAELVGYRRVSLPA